MPPAKNTSVNNPPASHDEMVATTPFLGYRISNSPLNVLTAAALAAASREHPQITFACANPHSLATADKDKEFRRALIDTNQLVADGVGLVLAAGLAGTRLEPRVTGNEYFEALLQFLHGQREKLGRKARVFFFGSSQHVLDRIAAKFERQYPNLELCGVLSPPFGEWDESVNAAMIATINAAQPDVLWVGMTAPKQEKWVYRNRTRLDAAVIGSIGAVFDFYAETYPRAPEWACRAGLEWLVRLAREPRRMWKRTFISLPYFLYTVFTRQHSQGA